MFKPPPAPCLKKKKKKKRADSFSGRQWFAETKSFYSEAVEDKPWPQEGKLQEGRCASMREELPAISPGQIQSRGPPKAESWPASARERAKTGPLPEGPPGREQRKQPVPSFPSQL